MKPEEYFLLGCKIFGVYCFVRAVPALIEIIPTFFEPQNLASEFRRLYTATIVAARLIPVIYITLGIYLLRGSEHFLRFAYPGGAEFSDKAKEKLNIFLRFLGLFLLISYFPAFLKTVATYIIYSHAPTNFDIFQDKAFPYANAVSSIWGVGFGIYLLRGGKVVEKFALQSMSRCGAENVDKMNS